MPDDPIVEEIRNNREKRAKKFNNDLSALLMDSRLRQEKTRLKKETDDDGVLTVPPVKPV